MTDSIDWQDRMTKTERSVVSAALNAERAAGGVAKALETHRQALADLAPLRIQPKRV